MIFLSLSQLRSHFHCVFSPFFYEEGEQENGCGGVRLPSWVKPPHWAVLKASSGVPGPPRELLTGALVVLRSTALIPRYVAIITVGQTWVSYLEPKSNSSYHTEMFSWPSEYEYLYSWITVWKDLFIYFFFLDFKLPKKNCNIVQNDQSVLQILLFTQTYDFALPF